MKTDNYQKTIIPVIEANYSNFTTIEKTIADFFISNRKKMNFSSKSVAELLYVSEASLSRFAKKCGYRGYRQFIYQYEEGFVERKEAMTSHSRRVLNTYQELLNKAYNLVDDNQISRISKALSVSERVVVCGVGSSGLAAREMESRFMRVGVDIKSFFENDMIRMQAVFLRTNSLVMGISISGEQEDILYLLKEGHQRGAKTILVTASNKEAFGEFCDEILILPSLRHLNHGNVVSPQFPISVMVDILYSYYTEKDPYTKEVLHDNTLKALKGKGKDLYPIS